MMKKFDRQRRLSRGGSDGLRSNLKALQHQVETQLQQLRLLEEENKSVKLKNEVLQEVIRCRDEDILLMSRGCSDFSSWVLLDTSTDLHHWTLDEVADYWRQLVSRFSVLLVQELHPGQLVEDAERELEQLLTEADHVFQYLCCHNPMPLYELDLINVETKRRERPPLEYWQNVVASLRLTSQQEKKIALCYDVFLKEEKRITEEKECLVQEFKALMNSFDQPVSIEDLHRHDQALGVLQKLSVNLRRSHSINQMLSAFVDGQVTPVQVARCSLTAYPYAPELHACLVCFTKQADRQNATCS